MKLTSDSVTTNVKGEVLLKIMVGIIEYKLYILHMKCQKGETL